MRYNFLLKLLFLTFVNLLSATTAHAYDFKSILQQDPIAKKIKQDPAASNLNFKVLNLALKSYNKVKNDPTLKYKLKNNYLTIVDYQLPSTKPRLWVIDLNTNSVLMNTLVAHGRNSGDKIAKKFSDLPHSRMSSLGVFITGEEYVGKHGLSMRLHGLERNFNANAYSRAIVLHAAQYVNEETIEKYGRLGRSLGCLAVNMEVIQSLVATVKDGTLVFSYYPDSTWLRKSNFL